MFESKSKWGQYIFQEISLSDYNEFTAENQFEIPKEEGDDPQNQLSVPTSNFESIISDPPAQTKTGTVDTLVRVHQTYEVSELL